MRKVEEYMRHADECRRLAASVTNDEAKQQMMHMAQTWEELANNRAEQLAREKRIAELESGSADRL